MKTSEFYYDLPPEQIAQVPIEPRHNSRLFVLRRDRQENEHTVFWQLDDYLQAGDLLVINQTRVIPARLPAHKLTGGKIEILLIRRTDSTTWETIIGGRGMSEGRKAHIDNGPEVEVIEVLEGTRRLVRFSEPIEPFLNNIGQMPLPPYIHTPLTNPERYQTVYAQQPGSAAAPTAGLHFTPELMQRLEQKGISFVRLTLHVGLDTFAPVTEDNIEEHKIHTEWCEVTAETARLINQTRQNGRKIIAVGTTSVRTLETAARFALPGQAVSPFTGPTNLFIVPGYQFKAVDGMITNFHLPKSTLLMLVSAFAGKERILSAYQQAIQMNYRFFSFGDAMLIL